MWWTEFLRPKRRLSRRGRKNAPRRSRNRAYCLSIEALEDRTLLTTTVFIDFGLGLQGELTTTVAELRDIDKKFLTGGGTNTGPDVGTQSNLPPSASLSLQPLRHDFDNN